MKRLNGWRRPQTLDEIVVDSANETLAPPCVAKTLYEASRVKGFFAINISSLPTFQEAQFCIDGSADSPAWRR
jgi:hypothetical protein